MLSLTTSIPMPGEAGICEYPGKRMLVWIKSLLLLVCAARMEASGYATSFFS